jgi:hypothetical protein
MSPEEQLADFTARYTPEIGALAVEVLAKMRARLPGAVEMVYDNYNALVIGFGPTERASEAIFSIILYPRWISLCFIHGASLPDPQKILRGSGHQVRNIMLHSAATLDEPAVRELIEHAIEEAPGPMIGTSPARLIIKSISPKQRPRRPAR